LRLPSLTIYLWLRVRLTTQDEYDNGVRVSVFRLLDVPPRGSNQMHRIYVDFACSNMCRERFMEPGANSIVLLDVTLRDGGYVNEHSWSRDDALAIVTSCAEAKIPYCEVGYFRPRRHEADGDRTPTACCPPAYLTDLHDRCPGIVTVVMAHARDVELTDYQRLAELGVGMVRTPAQMHLLPSLERNVDAAKAAGLQVTLNLIRVSEVAPRDVANAARLATRFGADAFYLADSNGSLFPSDVSERVAAAAGETDLPLGFHAHDGLSLAFINSLTALEAGCKYLDASLGGMGKGGGNLSLELIVGYLRARVQAPLSMVPLARAAAQVLEPWKGGLKARNESIASGLLDLNLDSLQTLRDGDVKELVSLVDALPV
jgi:4-hydroxy 2-oxovalerate aldolase